MSEAYKSGKIYKITSKRGNCTYYGSTIRTLSHRISRHKTDFNRGIYRNSGDVLKYPDYKIVLVEEYPCNNRQELCEREGWYISNNDCVNKQMAGRTMKEYYIDNKEYINQKNKQYYVDNKQYLKQKNKQHYINNIQYYKEYHKQYQIDNKQYCKERNKKYRIGNKQYLNQRLMCDCGISYTRQNKSQHNKTKRHIQRMINPFSTMLI
jgi:hypothetical protein